MANTTILDVSQYARLWRGVWWTQHLVMLLALVVGGTLVGASAVYLAGELEELANALIRETMGQTGLDAARREDALMNIAASYWIARGVLRDTPLAVASIIAASFLLAATYALGCRTFRLRLLTMNLLALAVFALVFGIALVQLVGTGVLVPDYDPPSGRVAKFADQALAVMCFIIFLPALVLLIVQGVLALRLWRHCLRDELAPTRLMTRSVGHNLTIGQFRLPIVSPAGAAIHLAVLGTLGALVWHFSEWLGQTLAYAPIYLLTLIIWLVFLPMVMLHRAFIGETVARHSDFADIVSMAQQSGRLAVIAVVLIAARALWRVGTRFNLRQRDAIILKDKPPVLLLRSFVDDVAGIPPNALIPRLLWRRKRLEETIGAELTRAGPFVAIGKPGERLPQIGAHRLYVGDADWQNVVTSYIARAEPIILIAGKTTWVQWELANIVALGRMNRLLIVFSGSADAERVARWENLKPALANTPWSAAADAIDIAGALAIFMQAEGFVVIRSRAAHESDYQGALRVATYLMGRGPEQGTSG
jgi:hypothetical protein